MTRRKIPDKIEKHSVKPMQWQMARVSGAAASSTRFLLMKKVIVLGCPGSGKSTFSRALHETTGIPLFHLDMMNWNADRTAVPRPVFLARQQNVLKQDSWILDGHYGSTIELRLRFCDTVFFLDYPTDICLTGVMSRKGKRRSDMPWIEPSENDEEFLDFIKRFDSDSKPAILKLLSRYPDKNITVFHSRAEAARFLEALKGK